jgi:hypothetical protein
MQEQQKPQRIRLQPLSSLKLHNMLTDVSSFQCGDHPQCYRKSREVLCVQYDTKSSSEKSTYCRLSYPDDPSVELTPKCKKESYI